MDRATNSASHRLLSIDMHLAWKSRSASCCCERGRKSLILSWETSARIKSGSIHRALSYSIHAHLASSNPAHLPCCVHILFPWRHWSLLVTLDTGVLECMAD